MLNKEISEIKASLTALETKVEAGNSDILEKDHKTVISSPVSCFYSKCPSNMENKPILR